MGRVAHKDKGYSDELAFQTLEFEFRINEINQRARNEDRTPNDLEKGMIRALKDLTKAAKELDNE